MIKNLLKVTVLGLVVWWLSPVLIHVLPLPTENMVAGYIDLDKEWGKTLLNGIRFVVWMIMFGVVLRFAVPMLSFIVPVGRQYSTSKFFRLIQGILAEVGFVGVIILIFSSPIAIIPAMNELEARSDTLRAKVEDDLDLTDDILIKEGMLVLNTQRAVEHMSANLDDYNITFDMWPLENEKRIDEYGGYWWESLSRYWSVNRDKDWFFTEQYEQDFKVQKEAFSQLKKLKARQQDIETSYTEAELNALIVQRTWRLSVSQAGGLFPLLYRSWKPYSWFLIALGIIIYGLIQFYGKKTVGALVTSIYRFIDQGRYGLGGAARFAGLLEEWELLFKKAKYSLYMGYSLYNPFVRIGLKDDRNMLTIAGARTGKGTTSLIPNLLLWQGSCVVLDPKGTNTAVTARQRSKIGKVHILDPFDIVKGKDKASFNPLDTLDPNAPDIREQINAMTEAIVVRDPHAKDPHWDDGAHTVISGLIAEAVSNPKYQNPTLYTVREMLSMQPAQQAELWADMAVNESAGRLAKDAAIRVMRGMETDEIAGILSNADKQTEWLSSPVMRETLGSSSFELSDLKEKPTTIYLVIPPHFIETHKRFLRLFVNMTITQMSIGGKSKIPVYVGIDEFLALGKMGHVEKAMSLMPGYNLILHPYVQDLGRFKELYGQSVNSFIANSRAVQVFGVVDEDTTEFVSKHLGERALNSSIFSRDKAKNVVRLRNPVEVAADIEANTGRQYILRAGKPPLVLQKRAYYKDFRFKGMYDPDPDYTKK